MEVERYTASILDPFGVPICSMTYHSFKPEDVYANWFAPILGDNKEVRFPFPANSPTAFSVVIKRG